MLMIVSATGDPSNVDKFTTGEVIEDWRLVRMTTISLRNVVLLPGGDGLRETVVGRAAWRLWVGNPGRISATISPALSVALPSLLTAQPDGLRDLPADGAHMKPRERRLVTLDVHTGAPFTKADAEAATGRDNHHNRHRERRRLSGVWSTKSIPSSICRLTNTHAAS